MDAQDCKKLINTICGIRSDCRIPIPCIFYDCQKQKCSIRPTYDGNLDYVEIAEYEITKQREEQALILKALKDADKPQLPEKIPTNDTTTTLYTAFAAINAIIDYLAAKEDS